MVERSDKPSDNALRNLIRESAAGDNSEMSRLVDVNHRAVNAQVERLQQILGKPLVSDLRSDKAAVTELGRMVLDAARQVLAASRKMRNVGQANDDPLRIGVSSIFIEKFASEMDDLASDQLLVSSTVCTELVRSFVARKLDVIMVLDVLDHREKLSGCIVDEKPVAMTWIKTADFERKADQPVPLAVWPGDGLALRMLDGTNMPYRKMFSSNDYFAKLAAVRSGKYISMMPRNAINAPFVPADDESLPALPVAHALIAVRGDGDRPAVQRVAAKLAMAHT